jgi:ABC-type transport system involved in cytochrome bd biosynthesis fused ATPase/permease subunit
MSSPSHPHPPKLPKIHPEMPAAATNASTAIQMENLSGKSLSWHNLSYTVTVKREQKQLLKDINGHVNGGEVVAIMGSSGDTKMVDETLSRFMKDNVRSGKDDTVECFGWSHWRR